jgi:predicted nucleic acid-binding protein
MLDTNVLISAIYNPNSTTFQAFRKVSEPPYVLVLCDQVIDELRRIFNRKFPAKIQAMERFLSIAHYDLVTLTSEDVPSADEPDIRDINDRPILRSFTLNPAPPRHSPRSEPHSKALQNHQ